MLPNTAPKIEYEENINIANIPNTEHSLKLNQPSPFDMNQSSPHNIDKIQELIDNKKIISTLRSIKTSTSLNHEDIKLLPSLFLDMQEALKKSNANVLDLKETIKEKIQTEKKLRAKLKELDSENKSLKDSLYKHKSKENELKSRIESFDEEIERLNQINAELEAKNKKYKNAHGILQNEISSIEEHLEDVRSFQHEIKKMQNETNKMKEIIKNLEDEKKKLKDENVKYINIIKDMKCELKTNLNEKIALVKEMEMSKAQNDQYEEIKTKYTELYEDFGNMIKENSDLMSQLQYKKFTDDDLNKLQEKFETELFSNKCEMNIWKRNFLDIAKFKLLKYDNTMHGNIEKILRIDNNYIQNASKGLLENSMKIVSYFKHLIEEENYQTINMRQLKEQLSEEQDRISNLQNKLRTEIFLRRKIHNRYMYLRGNLRVMCRIRPFLPSEVINKQSQMETILLSNDSITIRELGKGERSFEFDYIFNDKSSQIEVYEEATLLIQSMLQGNNVCIIAYGQTCTGKTHTIQGPGSRDQAGIAPRAAEEIFQLIANDKTHSSIRLTLTIIEIYNEQIFNLLDENTPSLSMYENANGNLVVPDLTPISISSFTEATKLFKLASKFRHTSSTEYNERSSRSHCVFTFKLKMVGNDGTVTRSTLNIIDLAGSERISKSTCEDELTKKEAICINLSLHALSSVLNAISIRANHIPYRDSKLTHFLKESLNENFNILLLLHVSPHIKDIGETISTLQFGTRIIKICKHKTGKDKIGLLGNNYKE